MFVNKNIKNKLMSKEEIGEELKLIYCSDTDYITPTGKIYSYYQEFDKYYPKTTLINKRNGYVYCSINKTSKGTNRVHKLVAMAYVENPNPDKLIIVGHKNNIKHDNRAENLYWTTNKENTDKAISDGLHKNKEGIDNEDSIPLKVVLNNNVVAVYGSICEASKHIKNITKTYIHKMLKRNGDYKTRSRKYKYIPITKEQFNEYDSKLKGRYLEELPSVDKSPTIFKATNILTGEEIISDNQTQFAKVHGFDQATVSTCISENKTYNNWKFEKISKTTYTEASCYTNFINTLTDIVIKNIKTDEILTFTTKKELKEYLGIEGNDVLQYYRKDQLILSEWKIVSC